MFRTFLSLIFLLFLSILLPAQAQTLEDSLRNIECGELYQLLSDGSYSELTTRIDQGGQSECLGVSSSGRPILRGRWYPGKIIGGVLHAIFGRNRGGTPYTLLSVAIKKEQSGQRDQFIKKLLGKTPELRRSISWFSIFLNNESNKKSNEVLRLLFKRFGLEDHRYTLSSAFRNGFSDYVNLFIETYGHQKAKYQLAIYSFTEDRVFFDDHLKIVGCFPAQKQGLHAERMLSSGLGKNHNFISYSPIFVRQNDWDSFVKTLKDNGALFTYKDALGHDLFQQAVANNLSWKAYALDKHLKWDYSRVDRKGQNLLHLASQTQNMDLITYVVGLGGDKNKKDVQGKIPADYLEDWNIITREMLGGKLTKAESNTLRIYKIALKKEKDYTQADKDFIKTIKKGMDFSEKISISKETISSFPKRKRLTDVAKSNGSWPLLARLVAISPADSHVSLYSENKRNLEASNWDYFREMIRSHPKTLKWFREETMDAYENMKSPNPKADQMLEVLMSGYELQEVVGKHGFYDVWGQRMMYEQFDDVEIFEKMPMTKFMSNGKMGLISLEGKVLIDAKYDQIELLAENYGSFGKEYYFLLVQGGNKKLLELRHFLSISKQLEVEMPREKIVKFDFGDRKSFIYTVSGSKKGLYKLSNVDLRLLLRCEYDEIILLGKGSFDNYYKLKKDGLYAWYREGSSESGLKFKYDDVRFDETSKKVSGLRKGKWKQL